MTAKIIRETPQPTLPPPITSVKVTCPNGWDTNGFSFDRGVGSTFKMTHSYQGVERVCSFVRHDLEILIKGLEELRDL